MARVTWREVRPVAADVLAHPRGRRSHGGDDAAGAGPLSEAGGGAEVEGGHGGPPRGRPHHGQWAIQKTTSPW